MKFVIRDRADYDYATRRRHPARRSRRVLRPCCSRRFTTCWRRRNWPPGFSRIARPSGCSCKLTSTSGAQTYAASDGVVSRKETHGRQERVRALMPRVRDCAVSCVQRRMRPRSSRRVRPKSGSRLLDAPDRVAGLKVDEVVARLQLKPGNVVADLGAGSGIFAVPLARAVGPTARSTRSRSTQTLVPITSTGRQSEQNVTNVRTVLGKFADPGAAGRGRGRRLPARRAAPRRGQGRRI